MAYNDMLAVFQLSVFLFLYQVYSNDLFVSHSGEDSPSCGFRLSPCATVRFAVMNKSRAGDTIYIDHYHGKPYKECTYTLPILVHKSLSIVGQNGKAIIMCKLLRVLFSIVGKDVITVLFENLVLKNASKAILQRFGGSYLTIKNCLITTNIAALSSTNSCLLHVFNSTFEKNVAGIWSTCGCHSFYVNFTSSRFYSSDVYLSDINHTKFMKVFVCRCNFVAHNGHSEKYPIRSGLSGFSLVYYTVEVVDIYIHESLFANFTDKYFGYEMGILIFNRGNYTKYRRKTSMIFDRLTFENNQFSSSALSFLDYSTVGSNVHYKIVNCVFHNNTNSAIFASTVQLSSIFDTFNIGSVVLQNNTFIKNYDLVRSNRIISATRSTLFLTSGKFRIISCRFLDNSHASSSSASVVHIYRSGFVSFKDCYFENSQVYENSVQINSAAFSSIKFIGRNKFNMRRLKSDQLIVSYPGTVIPFVAHILSNVTILDSFVVQCPTGYKVFMQNITLKSSDDEVVFTFLSISCKQCPRDTYSVEGGAVHNDIVSKIKCHSCVRGGQCENGKVRAKPKFWGYESQKGVSFLFCPSGYCCDNGDCKSFNSCFGNRTGQLCGRCPIGMSEQLFSTKCTENEKCKGYTFWLVFSVVLLLSFLFFLCQNEIITFLKNDLSFKMLSKLPSYCYLEKCYKYLNFASDGRNVSPGTGFLKIIFYYYQVIHILKSCDDTNDKHTLLGSLQELFTKLLNFIVVNIRFLDFDCPLQNNTPVRKAVLLHSMGFCLLGISLLTCLLLKTYKLVTKHRATFFHTDHISENILPSIDSPRSESNFFQNFTIRILCAFIHISLVMYSSSAQLVLTLLRCVPLGNHQILFIDGTLYCYQTFQYFLIAYTVFSTVPFFLVPILGSYALTTGLISVFQFCLGSLFPLPFVCYWFYRLVTQDRSQSRDDARLTRALSRKAVLDTLSGPFRSHDSFLFFCSSRLPWEGVLIFRRLIIVIAFTFIYDNRLRIMVIFTICLLILASHLYVKPFKSVIENFFETLSLSFLTILCGFSLVKAVNRSENYSSHSGSSKLMQKLNLTEDILILIPISIVILVTVLRIFTRMMFLVSFCVTFVYRKLRDIIYRITCSTV